MCGKKTNNNIVVCVRREPRVKGVGGRWTHSQKPLPLLLPLVDGGVNLRREHRCGGFGY